MSYDALLQLAAIPVLGITAQYAAWRLRIPSILLLLAMGIVAGPVTGLLKADALFGDLLLPIVSLSVAVILFEGGLGLKLSELEKIGGVVFRLTTVGVTIAWLINTLAAHYVLGFRWGLAGLLGCILIVTGPTVIGPILRQLRLGGALGSVLRWEGITIDPIGAILAVMFFTVVRAGELETGTVQAFQTLGRATLVGGLAGFLGGMLLASGLRRFWIPDSLHNASALAMVMAISTACNVVQSESGLLAATVMGIVVANQQTLSIEHIVAFKESLTVLLISALFIVLASRLGWHDLTGQGWHSLVFIGILVLIARPATAFLATLGSGLDWRERLFLSCMAPRGIVAVAVAAVFTLEMAPMGYPRAAELEPITFLVVFATVLLYGLAAFPLATRLHLVQFNPQGTLFVGAHACARAIARALHQEGFHVLLVDTDWRNIRKARMEGLPTFHGSILAENTFDGIDYGGITRLIALTPDDAINSLACLRYREIFGREHVYQLAFDTADEDPLERASRHQRGRLLFGRPHTFDELRARCGDAPEIKKTRLTASFGYREFLALHGERVLPLFVLKPDSTVSVFATANMPNLSDGDLIVSLVCPESSAAGAVDAARTHASDHTPMYHAPCNEQPTTG